MGFFDWKKEEQSPQKTYAIIYHSNNFGSFYVSKSGVDVCCSMDSAKSCGMTLDNVSRALMSLKTKFPERKFEMVEI